MTRTLLGLVASAVFLLRLLLQPVRLARTRVVEGVSPLAAMNALISDVAWLVYGILAHLPVVWGVSIVGAIPGIWTVALLGRAARRTDVIGATAFVGVLGLAATVHLFGTALAAGVIVIYGPQVVRALRARELGGISPATWWVALADATSWGAYGFVVHDGALLGYAAALFTSAVLVLGRLRIVGTGLPSAALERP